MNTAMRAGFRALSTLSPSLAARIASRIWFRIPAPRVSESAQAFLTTGERFTVDVNSRAVAAWRWGTGPTVVCVHGWGGHAGQFHFLINELTKAGIGAVTFDAPSHGASAPGTLGARYSTIFEFSDALRVIAGRTREIVAVVAHSGGCAAVGWALSRAPRLELPRLAFVAPFARPLEYMRLFQQTLGLSDAAVEHFKADTERRFDFRWPELTVPDMADRVSVPPTLVVHDREDRETSWEDGAAIADKWPGSRLVTTTGLGHNRILRDPETVRAVVDFVTRGFPGRIGAGRGSSD